jgi:arabinofuranosyltransferase
VLLLPAGAAVLVALTPVWTFSSSGLEGGLSFAWLGGCLLVLARWAVRGRKLGAPAAVLVGLGPLIRPDLGLLTVLFLAGVLATQWQDDGWGDRLRLLAAALALPLVYEVFRMGYYGSLVPNPAIAKEASRAAWSSGWRYLREATLPYWLWVPLAALVVGGYLPLVRAARREQGSRTLVVVGAFGIGGLLHALFVTRVGGDFMHARLLLPSIFAVVAPVAAVPVRRESLVALAVLPWAVVAVAGLRASADSVGVFGQDGRNLVSIEDFEWDPGGRNREWYTGEGAYFGRARLDAAPNPEQGDTVVATFGLGISGYALPDDVYVLDLLGLADVFTSHLELRHRGIVGHEKPLPAPWIVARLTAPGSHVSPDEVPLPTRFGVRALDDPDRAPFDERVAIAREVLRCRGVRDLLDAGTSRLTARRFLKNIVEAPGNTTLRIPPEPEDARAALCD